MKNLKKVLAVFLLVILLGGLTGCSKINAVTRNFEDQGFAGYKYTNVGESSMFALHDDLVDEEVAKLIAAQEAENTGTETTTTTEENTDTSDDGSITTNLRDNYFGFDTYVFSNDVVYALVIEFESEEVMNDFLDNSPALIAALEGLDSAEYILGNCVLIVPEDFVDQYDYFVDVFQGNLEPIEITEATATESSTATTTVAD